MPGDERAEAILRIAEEALRNVERHARATLAWMTLRSVAGTHLELCIRDNGVGFDPRTVPAGHFGLVGLREQAQLIGAQLEIASAPGSGTSLRLRRKDRTRALVTKLKYLARTMVRR